MKKISVITPAFNEEENLPAVHAELIPVLEGLGMEWEWIIIDDHSTDSTPDVIKGFARADSRIKGLRAAKNEGSHALCLFGFQKASGDCAVILSADGQDAPGNIARLVEEMKKTGAKSCGSRAREAGTTRFSNILWQGFTTLSCVALWGFPQFLRTGETWFLSGTGLWMK